MSNNDNYYYDDDDHNVDESVLSPLQRHGSFLVFDFEGAHERLTEMLELIAAWLRACAEYQLELPGRGSR